MEQQDSNRDHAYRFIEGIKDWWQIAVPGFLRPNDRELNFSENVGTTWNYGVSTSYLDQAPVMNIGDLFSRFGWVGLVLGMAFIGAILTKLDKSIIISHKLQKLPFFILFARVVWRLYTASPLIVFVSSTRDLAIILLLSHALALGASRQIDTGLKKLVPNMFWNRQAESFC